MTAEHCRKICDGRFAIWAGKFAEGYATPVLAVGVGHGPKQGQLVLETLEDLSDDVLIAFTRYALKELEKRRSQPGG
jgi:uncharacterized protein (DUF608 family)